MAKQNRKKPVASRNQNGKGGKGELRIIGGDFRGRKLPVLDAEGLRPTSDRVRETLFNWLQFEIAGAHCLDVFAILVKPGRQSNWIFKIEPPKIDLQCFMPE